MGSRIRAFEWSKSSLGPTEKWPQSLRSVLSMMLPSKAQIVLFWGPEFVVLYNDAYRPVFGAKHPEALGMPGRQAWSEIWETMLHGLLEGVVSTGEAFWAKDLMFPIERYGFLEETYFDVSYDPVRDESGRVAGVYCIVTETTDRVVWDRRLELLKDLSSHNVAARTPRDACRLGIETLTSNANDIPFALVYLDNELQACTPGAPAQLSASKPDHIKELTISHAGHDSPGKLIVGLNLKRPFDASYQTFLERVAGQFSTAIAIAQAYEEERKRAEALAELDRAKTDFFSNVSHEFRTPLTLMLGPVEELLAQESTKSRELAAVIQRNGQRLLKLVNTLLDFARIEAGRVQATFKPTDMSTLTADLASNFRAACDKAGLRLEVDCPMLDEGAWLDREMWEKIVLNLLSNAFKFTMQGGITVAVRDAQENFRLVVSDTGVGMPQEALGRVFERFHRVEGVAGRSHEGSGIGLALVHELVKLHGGSITVESKQGNGTTFTVDIPKGYGHLPAKHVVQTRQDSTQSGRADAYVSEVLGWLPGSSRAAPVQERKSGGRILVADDNADLREYASRLLSEHYEVETVSDGAAALDAARARRPDLIVSDVMMPKLDGFALVREVRNDPALTSIPVIMLSARAGEEARLEGLHRGADDYLVKPFSARELLGHVAALLQADEMRQRALNALRQSNAQVKALLDHAPIGAYLVDADFRIREVNPVAQPVFGDIPGGVIGRDFGEIVHIMWEEKYADEMVTLFRHTLDTGKPYVAPERAEKRRDRGITEYYEWRIDRIPLPDGHNGVVCYFRDVSAQVNARKAIEESREALRETDRRKDEFLATLSHELRNPLAPLRNGLQLMRLSEDDVSRFRQVREIMERQLNHLVRLVDDLLEMSRITSGAFELRRDYVELSTIVRNAVETSAPLIQAGKHRLDVSLPGEALWLRGDSVRLAQIISNLLNNAAKYTDRGGLITLSARRDEDLAVIGVRDNGRGIAAEGLARIFDMFRREGTGEAHDPGGLGVGLTLSRRLVEMHDGTIEARSPGLGHGSEFIVRLPLARPGTEVSTSPEERGTLSPIRILIVDDNRDAAKSLGMVLEAHGAEIHLAYDGKTAIDLFATASPSVVLLDIGMPGMDGYEVARSLRATCPDRPFAIVALTGWGQENDRRRTREAGIDYHLVKPADIEMVRKLLNEIAQKNANRAFGT